MQKRFEILSKNVDRDHAFMINFIFSAQYFFIVGRLPDLRSICH